MGHEELQAVPLLQAVSLHSQRCGIHCAKADHFYDRKGNSYAEQHDCTAHDEVSRLS